MCSLIRFNQFHLIGAYYDDRDQQVDKHAILEAVITCRTSQTIEDYCLNRATLMHLAGALNVKPGRVKNSVKFADYFFSNWDSVAPMWVYAYRKQLPLQVACSFQLFIFTT